MFFYFCLGVGLFQERESQEFLLFLDIIVFDYFVLVSRVFIQISGECLIYIDQIYLVRVLFLFLGEDEQDAVAYRLAVEGGLEYMCNVDYF